MGSGLQAARESDTAIRLIQAMLEAGFPLEATIQAINSILILRSPQEVFATVDMALVDLTDGSLEMAKIGACPSYLVRHGEVELLAAKGLPLGIVDDIPVTRLQHRLHPGDCLVMISDGVFGGRAGAPRREDWVRKALQRQSDLDPQKLADELLAKAVGRQPGIHLDDAAVLVASLRRAAAGG
jgi:stage II sporulation protein E